MTGEKQKLYLASNVRWLSGKGNRRSVTWTIAQMHVSYQAKVTSFPFCYPFVFHVIVHRSSDWSTEQFGRLPIRNMSFPLWFLHHESRCCSNYLEHSMRFYWLLKIARKKSNKQIKPITLLLIKSLKNTLQCNTLILLMQEKTDNEERGSFVAYLPTCRILKYSIRFHVNVKFTCKSLHPHFDISVTIGSFFSKRWGTYRK